MNGIQYELACPFCGKNFMTDHATVSYYNIRGHGDSKYILEHCQECNTDYYRRCSSENFSEDIGWYLEFDSVKKEDLFQLYTIAW